MAGPVICFGQQPCGFFPKRFLVAKFRTAKRLQSEIGGEIVFFYHDADHDPRETKTTLRDKRYGDAGHFNFEFENKVQRKYSPLYLKRVMKDWQFKAGKQLREYVGPGLLEAFVKNEAGTVADFCLEMYRAMGLLDGVRVVRSGDKEFRRAACEIEEFFADVPHEGEIVRARWMDGVLKLHEGGESYVTLPGAINGASVGGNFAKEQISPTRDSRLKWMQSVVGCTHYVAGLGEQAYLNKGDAPEITYVVRETIERSDEAYAEREA